MILLDNALLNPSPGLIFWQLVVFGSLVFILWKFAWKGIISALKEREGEIEGALRMAEETRAEMAKLKSDNDKLVAEAKKERDLIIKEAKEASDKMLAEAKDRAVEQGNKIMEDAREVMTQERVKMMSQIKKDVATLSIEIAEKVIRKELADKATQQSFISELVADAKLN
ncbi:MAG: F0F1 ATP synthase subunit B [Leadbetterella sp.]|jgi:F-type H+-transporting ATPase subunit b|uniref:F0F1 ATP synthase subunit B n=1 Tax=Lacihabitans sp. CCS-44 TaxID=2487331 RepID=UPI001B43750E|nr:F0F1 ATP synthase subunit B [Lacihabitans sp. CCS-44]MBP6618901.1 F0F1 ATP synthase subunit B [Leadbetterella sp.]MBP8155654.1 F0F1 ATP synthase subunit B [Leadbetterella sp.]MCP9756187.1 ATP synthase F0 subunit B [Lacihabitans sp. CCS-44]